MLYTMTQEQLGFIDFPLGGLHKTETRALARHFELPVAEKAESQEICFVGKRSYADFVAARRPDVTQPGDVVNKAGHQRDGWIEVATVERLPDGRVNIADATYQKSFTSEALDIIWLQIVRPLQGNSHLALPG